MLTLPEDLDGRELRIAIVVSRFNTLITERLLGRRARRAGGAGSR